MYLFEFQEIVIPPNETVEYFDDPLNRNVVNKLGAEANQLQLIHQFQASIMFDDGSTELIQDRATSIVDDENALTNSAATTTTTTTSMTSTTATTSVRPNVVLPPPKLDVVDRSERSEMRRRKMSKGKGKEKEPSEKQRYRGLTLIPSDDEASTALFTAEGELLNP